MCASGVYEAWRPEVFRSSERSVGERLSRSDSGIMSGSPGPPEVSAHEGQCHIHPLMMMRGVTDSVCGISFS